MNSYEHDEDAQKLLMELPVVNPNAQGFLLKYGLIYKGQ